MREGNVDMQSRVISRRERVRRRRRRSIYGYVACALLLLVALLGVSGYRFLRSLRGEQLDEMHLQVPLKPGERVNVLFLGIDAPLPADGELQRKDWTRTDTIILGSFDLEDKNASLLSIPRDTMVEIPGRGKDKANAAHAYGGPSLAVAALEKFLGVTIHYYVRTNFAGFARIVDILGGVELEVEKDMDYEDPEQDLYIHLRKGLQVLDGDKALQYVRYRDADRGDIGRIERQQKFISTLVKKMFRVGTLFKLPGLSAELARHISTNMDPGEILLFARMAAQTPGDEIETGIVPGREALVNGVSYWLPDAKKLKRVVDETLRGIDFDGNAKVSVEVLNGAGVPGLGAVAANLLRDYGYNVVRVGTADRSDYRFTEVLSRTGELEKARRVATALRGAKVLVDPGNSAPPGVDVTVVLGEDFRE